MAHAYTTMNNIILGLVIWFCINVLLYGIVTFDGGMHELDDNYLIGGWPGRIWQRHEMAGFSLIAQIERKVDKFLVTDEYILFKAGNAWYAINRQDRILSEYETESDLKKTLKLKHDISFKSSRPWLRLRFFRPTMLISMVSGGCIFLLLFLPRMIRALYSSRSTGHQ